MKRTRPITGTHLFQRERCRRFVWLEFHGDPDVKAPADARLEAVLARGRAHEREVIAGLNVVEPQYPRGDFEAGARATAELLHSRTPLVYQGVLSSDGQVGIPDLLRYDAEDGQYLVGDVKASAVAKVEHAMQVAFYSGMLKHVPGMPLTREPRRAFLLLAGGREETVDLTEVAPLFDEAIHDVKAMRSGETAPRAAFCQYCHGCAWRNVCIPEMEKTQDLSLVFGITPARRHALEDLGIVNIQSLAAAEPNVLATRCEMPRETLRRLRLQASSVLDGAARALGQLPFRPARFACTATIGRDARGTHYSEFLLHRTSRVNDTLDEKWFHAVALTADDEGAAYGRMLHALHEDKDAPIYHYGPAFPDALSSLDAVHGKSGDPLRFIFERLVDVQAALRCALVLPVHSYDLDSVARALGLTRAPSSVSTDALDGAAARVAERRSLAAEVLLVREIRVAAQREWKRLRRDGASVKGLTDDRISTHVAPA